MGYNKHFVYHMIKEFVSVDAVTDLHFSYDCKVVPNGNGLERCLFHLPGTC